MTYRKTQSMDRLDFIREIDRLKEELKRWRQKAVRHEKDVDQLKIERKELREKLKEKDET